MSWFGSLTSALSGQSNNQSGPSGQSNNGGNNAGTPNGSSGGGSAGNSSPSVHVYDGSGNPVNNQPNNPPNNQNQNQQNNQSNNQSNQSNQPADIESLLFAEPENNNNNNNNNQPNNQNQQNNQSNTPAETEIAPGFTQSQLINNIKSVNFANAIPAELVTQALGGDTQAFAQAMNNIAQISAAIAVQQSTAISKSLLDKQKGEWDTQFSSRFSDNQFSSITADPKYSNPFIKPMVENIVGQMRKRDANITPDQVRTALPKLLEHAIKSVNIGNSGQPNNQNNPSNNTRQQANTVSYDDLF